MKLQANEIRKIHTNNELIFNKKCIDASTMNFNSKYEIISFTNLMNNELNTYPECITSPDKQLHKTYEDIDLLKVIPANTTIIVPPGNAFLKEDNTDDDIFFFYQSKSNNMYAIRKSTFANLHLPLPTVSDIKYYDTTNDLLEVNNKNIPNTSPVDRYVYYTQKDVIVKFEYKDYIINMFKQKEKQEVIVSPFIDKDYIDTISDEYTKLTDQTLYKLSEIVLDESDPELLPNTRRLALKVIRNSKPEITQEIINYDTKISNQKVDNESTESVPSMSDIQYKENLLGMSIHELFDSIRYQKDKPIADVPELDIDKMMHDIKNEITVDTDTWSIFTCKSMDMSKKYDMSGSPADSNSIEFDVYLGKLTVTTQGTYGYIYNRKTRESILCLKKEDYDKAVKRLFNIDMNSSKDDVPNIVVNENGYKVATSSTGKSYISKLTAESDTNITDTLESDTDDSYKNNSKENSKNDSEDKPFDDGFFDDLVRTESTNTESTNTNIGTNMDVDVDNTDSLEEKLEKIKLEERAALKHEDEHEDNQVLYGKYNSDVSFANAYNKKMQQQAASIPEEYINHCNIDPKDVKTDSGSDVFARYANMTFNITPIPPEAEQNVHVCEDIHTEDIHKDESDAMADTDINKNINEDIDKNIDEDVCNDSCNDSYTDTADITRNTPDSVALESIDESKPNDKELSMEDIVANNTDSVINDDNMNVNKCILPNASADNLSIDKSNASPDRLDIKVLDDEEYVKEELERDMSRINSMYNQKLINFNDIDSIVPKDENEKIVLDILKFRRKHNYHPVYPNTYKDYSNFFFNDDFYNNLNDELIDKIIHADLDAMDTAAFNSFIKDLPDKEKWIVRTAKLCYLYTGTKLFNDDKSINEAAKIKTEDITNDTDNMFDKEGFEILVDYNMELARKHIIGGAKFLDKEECDMWIEEEKRIRNEKATG